MRKAFAFAVATALFACVGDDPVPVDDRGDGGDAGSSSGADATTPPVDAGPPRRVFVTSAAIPGDFGGFEKADSKCMELARAASVAGSFKAWLSAGTSDAISRFTWEGGWELADRTLVVGSKTELLSGALRAPIAIDEGNHRVPDGTRVWTNTDAEGKVAQAGYDCEGFTKLVPAGQQTSPGGRANEKNESWTRAPTEALPCSGQARLYCFEQ